MLCMTLVLHLSYVLCNGSVPLHMQWNPNTDDSDSNKLPTPPFLMSLLYGLLVNMLSFNFNIYRGLQLPLAVKRACLLLLPCAQQPSQHVLVDAGFPCNKADAERKILYFTALTGNVHSWCMILFHTIDWVLGKSNHSEDLRTKGKLSLYIMKAYCRVKGITPPILILGIRWRWVVSLMPEPLHP